MNTFGSRFKELRNSLNLTQEELRKTFNKKYNRNFTAAAISMYENNKRIPEIDALIDFSNFFGVSLDYLMGKSNIRNPYIESETINNKVNTIAAHLDSDDLSEDDLEDINNFINFIRSKNKDNK